MDVILFAALIFGTILLQLLIKDKRKRILLGSFLVIGIFFFFLSQNLEVLAACFLVNLVLAGFNFKESFSVVDYRKEKSEWSKASEFLAKNRPFLITLFVVFHILFFVAYSLMKDRVLVPVAKTQILSSNLGNTLNTSHWVGVLILFITSAILINVNGQKKK